MIHAPRRNQAAAGLKRVLTESSMCRPPTNLEFLAKILDNSRFISEDTMKRCSNTFKHAPYAIDVISVDTYTLIQDLPVRPSVDKGIPHSGPMDPLVFQISNMLVENSRGKEGLEIALSSPELRFVGPAIIALCCALMETSLNGKEFPMWTRVKIEAGQRLKIGKTTGGGYRSCLAIHGGFPTVAEYFGSKSTSPLVAIGGYKRRALALGDLLQIMAKMPERFESVSIRECI